MMDRPWKKCLSYALYIYAAFALTGQHIFIYPLDFIYGIAIIYYEGGAERRCSDCGFVCLMVVFLLMPASYNLFANNPGMSSLDAVDTMISAHQLRGIFDYHPTFYCIMLRLILNIWDSTYDVILVQYFFWVNVMVKFMLYFRKKGG